MLLTHKQEAIRDTENGRLTECGMCSIEQHYFQ